MIATTEVAAEKPPEGNPADDPVSKFALALEIHRREKATGKWEPKDFRSHFFPYAKDGATDEILRRMPKEVRGPILTAWGIRGQNRAKTDSDEKVLEVTFDALTATPPDLDDKAFEEGVDAEKTIRWADLRHWWKFWRAGNLRKEDLTVFFRTAFELNLVDAKIFFAMIEDPKKKLTGIDVVSTAISPEDRIAWIRAIYETRDRDEDAILMALGWEKIVIKVDNAILITVADRLAERIGLVHVPPPKKDEPAPVTKSGDTITGELERALESIDGRPKAEGGGGEESGPKGVAADADSSAAAKGGGADWDDDELKGEDDLGVSGTPSQSIEILVDDSPGNASGRPPPAPDADPEDKDTTTVRPPEPQSGQAKRTGPPPLPASDKPATAKK